MGKNKISNSEMLVLSKSFNNLRQLTSLILYVKEEKLESPGLETLVTSISKMVHLETLKLSLIYCQLNSSHFSSIFLSVQHLVNLRHLSLIIGVDKIQKNQMLSITKKFRNFKRLQTIEFVFPSFSFFSFNNIQIIGLEEQDFEKLVKLSCIKNARSLVNYEMGTLNSFEY